MQIKVAGFYVYVDITVAKINDAIKKHTSSFRKVTTAEKTRKKAVARNAMK